MLLKDIKYDFFYVKWDVCLDEKGVLKNYHYIGKIVNNNEMNK